MYEDVLQCRIGKGFSVGSVLGESCQEAFVIRHVVVSPLRGATTELKQVVHKPNG
jgi:hypothetical protein